MNAMQALDRARRAWERTSPQLVIDGWLDMLDELDETQGMAECRPPLRLVEPAPTAPLTAHSPGGGLNPGAEPCRGVHLGTDGSRPATADTVGSVSSAPFQYDGPCRISPDEVRGRGQRGV